MTALSFKQAGNEAFKKGKYGDAVSQYSLAMQLDPSESTYPLNRSMAYLKLEKYVEAERDATKSLNLLPAGNPKAFFRRGLARKALKKFKEAREDFEAALRDEPNNASIKTELDSLPKQERSTVPTFSSLPQHASSPVTPSSSFSTSSAAPTALEPKPTPKTASERPVGQSHIGEDQTQDLLDEKRKKVLKAAITPESSKSISGEADLLSAVSTRRLQPQSQSETPHIRPQRHAAAEPVASTSKGDFAALRSRREEKVRAATPVLAVQHSATPPTSGKDSQQSNIPLPKNTFEFERRWSNSDEWQPRVGMLKAIQEGGVSLPILFGQTLSPELIDEILLCLKESIFYDEQYKQVAVYFLENLPKCARFDFVSMLAGETAVVSSLLGQADTRSDSIRQMWGI